MTENKRKMNTVKKIEQQPESVTEILGQHPMLTKLTLKSFELLSKRHYASTRAVL
jgi:hypothetical protein